MITYSNKNIDKLLYTKYYNQLWHSSHAPSFYKSIINPSNLLKSRITDMKHNYEK